MAANLTGIRFADILLDLGRGAIAPPLL